MRMKAEHTDQTMITDVITIVWGFLRISFK